MQKWIAEGLVKDKWANLFNGHGPWKHLFKTFSKKLFIKMANACSVIRGSILSGSGSGLHCFSPNVIKAT